MKQLSVQRLATAAMMTALVCVLTIFPHIPLPSGYIHMGDGMIFLAVMLLGPLGVAASALGSMLADLIVFPAYAPITLVVKGLMAMVAMVLCRKEKHGWNIVAFALAELVMVGGYFLYEWFVAREYAMMDIPGNCVQGLAGVALGMVFSLVVPRLEQAVKL